METNWELIEICEKCGIERILITGDRKLKGKLFDKPCQKCLDWRGD